MHKYMIVGSILLTLAPANTNAQQLDLSFVSGQAVYTAAALIWVVLKPVLMLVAQLGLICTQGFAQNAYISASRKQKHA